MHPTDKGSAANERYSQNAANTSTTPPPLSISLTRAQAPQGELLPIDGSKADAVPTLSTSSGTRERFSSDIDIKDKMARQNTHARMMIIVLGSFVATALVIGAIFVFATAGRGATSTNHNSTTPVVFANSTTPPTTLAGMTTVTVFPVTTQTALPGVKQTSVSTTPIPSAQPTGGNTPATAVPPSQPTTVPPTATPVPATGWNTVATKDGPSANGYRTAIILNEYYDPQQCGGWCNHWQGKEVIAIPNAAANYGQLSMGVFGYANSAGGGAQPSVSGQWNLQDFAYNQDDMFTGPEIFTPCANVSFVFTQSATTLFNFSFDRIYCKP